MILFEKEFLKDLRINKDNPCLSLYQPTHRSHPDNQQDTIRYRNLVKKLEQSLKQKYSESEANELLEPFHVLLNDSDFWNQTLDGLAIFRSPSLVRVYALQRSVPELAIVADTFHTKPLQRYTQTTDRFQILGISLQEVFLFEGNRDKLDRIPLPEGVPGTIEEALGSDLTDEHITIGTYGGKTAKGVNMVHGHGGKKDEMDVDAERFFKTIDRTVYEHCSKASGLPLILAALPEHHSLFQELSHNPFLVDEGIRINPESQSEESLRQHAWKVWEARYQKKIDALREEFQQAEANKKGSTALRDIARAAVEGKVGKLLIEDGKVIRGKVFKDSGNISHDEIDHPEIDDVLDDLGQLVLDQGGEIAILPAEEIPGTTGAAAIFRY